MADEQPTESHNRHTSAQWWTTVEFKNLTIGDIRHLVKITKSYDDDCPVLLDWDDDQPTGLTVPVGGPT